MAAIALVMTSLSVIAVALRCYTMIAILKRFLVEDWLAVLTCVSATNACLPVEFVLILHLDTSSFSAPSAPLCSLVYPMGLELMSSMSQRINGPRP